MKSYQKYQDLQSAIIILIMRAIDQQSYQTLKKSLIVSYEHPFRPHHGASSEGQQVGRKAIMKNVVKLHLQQKTVKQDAYFSTSVKERGNDNAQFNIFLEGNRPNTDDLIKQVQAFIIHPQLDMQLQASSSPKQPEKIFEKKVHNQQNLLTRDTTLKLQDLIDSQQIPMKKENYFQNIRGFNKFYKNDEQKYRQVPGKRYPILFVSNLSLLLTLFLAIRINDHLVWIVYSGVCLFYILAAYFNDLRIQLFSMKKVEELRKAFDGVSNFNCHFYFHIECFHYIKIKGIQHKIITYKKCKKLKAINSQDQTFSIDSIINDNGLFFLTTKSQFYFQDKQSEQIFAARFNRFVEKNKRDTHQKYCFQFKTEQSNLLQGVFYTQSSYCRILYIFYTLIGLLFPYAIYLQNNTKRYEASIIKKISLL